MFEGNRAAIDSRQQVVELACYLGIGYRELMESPRWFLEIAAIRLREQGEYNAYVSKEAQKKK